MIEAARQRARKQNVPFTITQFDLTMPKLCPILGIPLAVKDGKGNAPNSPSLDKINPSLGYVPGNVQIISSLANTMKNNVSLEQMVKLGEWAKRQLYSHSKVNTS